jgi:hypothetical protein
MRRFLSIALVALATQPLRAQGAIAGHVVGPDSRPIEAASLRAERLDRSIAGEATSDATGAFRMSALAAGTYTVTARRVGYREARLVSVRVAEGQTVTLDVTLTQAPRQLSTIHVVTSPTSIDASTPELTVRLDRTATELLPSARDASSLIALIPGARKEQLWGGAPGVSNDYQLDGVSMNHPGLGGDFLALSVDWIEALDIRGLGAGAEHGNFQGGIINAITKTGSNERRFAMRTNVESARLTASNFNRDEQGVEPAGRREFSGEALGPVARDRLFYFVAGQFVDRDLRSPNLSTADARDFQSVREEQLNARGVGKLTWLPALGQRVDLLAGFTSVVMEHAGINGVDDPSATVKVSQPTGFYELAWNNTASARNVFTAKVAGFSSREMRSGYGGLSVPGVQLMQLGRMPTLHNAAFDSRAEPLSRSGSVAWQSLWNVKSSSHRAVLGADFTRGTWREKRTRNGGLTWRPYTAGDTNFDAFDATTWDATASEWGGEVRLDSDVASEALFLQDYVSIGSRLTVTPGIRWGRWRGFITPPRCPLTTGLPAPGPCGRFEAVRDDAFDPRLGVAWDVTGRNTLAIKAHVGRYHQGMYSLFFDRVQGANVYTNQRFYYTAPPLTSASETFTPGERDTPGSGFSTFFDEIVLNESGRVEHYRQPYVDQFVVGVEKTFGPAWKGEVVYTHRKNGDIVGLVDRNRATNYSPIYNVAVDHRFATGRVLDARGDPLVIPVMYVSNRDLVRTLYSCGDTGTAPCPNLIAGYSASDSANLPWAPDLVLTSVPEAHRKYQQLSMLLRTEQRRWRGEASLTGARLRGNVPGVTGYGSAGTRFSAGPFVRPNEAINSDGFLPDALEMEGKIWLTARLSYSLQAGLLFTHTLGERFAPTFRFENRYTYADGLGAVLPYTLFPQILGQSMFVEPRGSRQYASRDVMDAHLEWRPRGRLVVTMDVFNVGGANALTLINTNIGDQTLSDPTSFFGAPRLRVAPRTLRVGLRVD